MKFENISIMNFQNALRGMRNPKESWNLSDTETLFVKNDKIKVSNDFKLINNYDSINNTIFSQYIKIGPNDMKLAKTLIKSGSVHRKFLRQIFVSVDITAPKYWWNEYATYKIGTTENSTSTMHKLASTPITKNCFEMDDYDQNEENDQYWNFVIEECEKLRMKYNETKNKKYWKELIRRLPDSWLQKRTCTLNYEILLNICQKDCRRNHKLNEWSGKDDNNLPNFINFVKSLPYADEFIFYDINGEKNVDK
jgi:hypothetical protein